MITVLVSMERKAIHCIETHIRLNFKSISLTSFKEAAEQSNALHFQNSFIRQDRITLRLVLNDSKFDQNSQENTCTRVSF